MARALKVYYDVTLAGASASQVLDLATADRFGNLLDPITALTGGAPDASKRRNTLSAWFVPFAGTHPILSNATVPAVFVDFMRNTTLQAVYLTVGGASVPEKQGMTNLFTSNARVRVGHSLLTSRTFRGTLFVQRQHSIEA